MNITSFLIYCFVITFTPGPTNIVILSTVNTHGTKKAMDYTYGATIAFCLLLTLSAILNTILTTIIPKILIIMQLIGSIYMLYLAFKLYKSDSSKLDFNQSGSLMNGFLMQFLNPKVVLFTITVIPSFVLPYYNTTSAITISVLVISIIGFLAFLTWVLFGTIFRKFLQRYQKAVNVLMALFLVYAAFMIWM